STAATARSRACRRPPPSSGEPSHARRRARGPCRPVAIPARERGARYRRALVSRPPSRSRLGRVENLTAAILAAVRAGAVPQRRLVAVGTRDEARRAERVVRATLVALGRRRPSFRNCHDDASSARSGVAVDLEIAERGPAWITGLDHACALAGIAVDAALRAEPPALFTTERARGQGEHDLLVDERSEVYLGAFIEGLRQVTGGELDLPGERGRRRQHQREVLLDL